MVLTGIIPGTGTSAQINTNRVKTNTYTNTNTNTHTNTIVVTMNTGRRCVGASSGPFKAQIFHWGRSHNASKVGKGSNLRKARKFQSKPLFCLYSTWMCRCLVSCTAHWGDFLNSLKLTIREISFCILCMIRWPEAAWQDTSDDDKTMQATRHIKNLKRTRKCFFAHSVCVQISA